ncbi:hypothetical protein KAW18_17840 [candidate division WOR-3 bacterium]|nr:hypothetical protein [candidate division WOR-3 bacterium]
MMPLSSEKREELIEELKTIVNRDNFTLKTILNYARSAVVDREKALAELIEIVSENDDSVLLAVIKYARES